MPLSQGQTSQPQFSNQHVVVAGGTAGINRGIAEAFAHAGANVSVFSRSQDKVDATVAALRAIGVKAFGAACDVRDYDKTLATLTAAHAALGPIDVLVSGAAGNFPAPALGLSSNGFRAVIDIDLVGTFHVMRAAFEFLRKPGASVINISAQQAFQPAVMQIHACAAKAGVDQITRVLALEWGAAGVRVNSIVPGAIAETGGMDRLAPKGGLPAEAVAQVIPLGRVGTKQDVARLAMFLSSEQASYITGTVIPVDGGMTLNGAGLFGQVLQQAFAEQHAKG